VFILFLYNFALQAEVLRIEIDDLSKNISKYKIIDVRVSNDYKKNHLKGALNFPADLTYENTKIDGRISKPSTIQTHFRNLGLDTDDKIVIYDEGNFFDAARVFWTFEVYGFKNVKLLNGGYNEWEEKNLPISNEIPKIKKSDYIASINNKRLSTKFTTQIATKNPNQVIIDARSYDAYIGKTSVAQRFGHIPKAIHIPAIHNLNKEDRVTKLKNTDSLKDLYKDITKDKKVVIYCAIGKIASTNYFALRELGYNVSNYDASWKEWGNDFNLPIEKKSE
jgi:thiosulfate/3-mercaptopyruvate sulfurtransferase